MGLGASWNIGEEAIYSFDEMMKDNDFKLDDL